MNKELDRMWEAMQLCNDLDKEQAIQEMLDSGFGPFEEKDQMLDELRAENTELQERNAFLTETHAEFLMKTAADLAYLVRRNEEISRGLSDVRTLLEGLKRGK